VGEKQNQPFQLSFNPSLKVDFQGSRVTSDGGLLLVRELDERLELSALILENIMDGRPERTCSCRSQTCCDSPSTVAWQDTKTGAGHRGTADAPSGAAESQTHAYLGPVDIHLRASAVAARWIMTAATFESTAQIFRRTLASSELSATAALAKKSRSSKPEIGQGTIASGNTSSFKPLFLKGIEDGMGTAGKENQETLARELVLWLTITLVV
jgi:hypothetical protein